MEIDSVLDGLKKLKDEGKKLQDEGKKMLKDLLDDGELNGSAENPEEPAPESESPFGAVQEPEEPETEKPAAPALCQITLRAIDPSCKIETIACLREFSGLGIAPATEFVESLPGVIRDNLTMEECRKIQARFDALGAVTEITEDTDPAGDTVVINGIELTTLPRIDVPRCPQCGSSSLAEDNGIVAGALSLIGLERNEHKCANCGYTWKTKA